MPFIATSLADLLASLSQRVDASLFFTTEEARLALNEALRDWNLLTGYWRRRLTRSSVAPAAGVPVTDYALGATMTYGMRIALSTGQPLIPTSQLELDLARPTWRRETTASGGDVPTLPTLWAPLSLQTLSIWPATATAVTNYLLIDGVANTPVLVEDGDTIDCGEELVDLLTDYAIHVLTFKEAGPRWRATMPAYQQFLQAAAEENSVLKTKQAFRKWAGLDRRDLRPTKGVPTGLDAIAAQQGQGGGG